MDRSLADLAEKAGIESAYISESGELRVMSDEVKLALLELLGTPENGVSPEMVAPSGAQPCFVPSWLHDQRAWGIAAQLYGVRSGRNAGIGDFEDLARLAEMFAPLGADFIGVNPLHALFFADPERASPYSPSSKRFLNPIYIALDRVVRERDLYELNDRLHELRSVDLVDYAGVAALKRAVLETAFAQRSGDPAFEAFCEIGADALERFAVFEALSEHFAAEGLGAGWHGWPQEFHDPAAASVAEFAAHHARRIDFHKWLQWTSAEQLAEAQRRAREAGMRIGIYLDLAVGVTPEGSAAWSDKDLYATGARVGAPPDMFNHLGQDWGLTPMRPTALSTRGLEPAKQEISAAMKTAGAVRLDHAMGLVRLYWLPSGSDARSGGYVRYPMDALLNVLGRSSEANRCLVIGEDLGTVPPGFREKMQAHHILSYRVLYFERTGDGLFIPPQSYPKEALACVATHDLPPLRGWWCGSDIEARAYCRVYECDVDADQARAQRAIDRQKLLESLAAEQLLDGCLSDYQGQSIPDDVFTAVHRYLARSPAWLFGVQLEDIAGSVEMVNLPGTDRQYANWRRKIPLTLEELPQHHLMGRTVEAIAAERPRHP
jgi:4-alpha-glucanotransferase